MEYLTSSKFDNSWQTGACAFVLHWNNQVRQYNELCSSTEDRISDNIRLSLLQKAVTNIPELRAVKITGKH